MLQSANYYKLTKLWPFSKIFSLLQMRQKRTHTALRKKHRARTLLQQTKISRLRGACGLMCGAGGRPRRLWLSLSGFMCLLGIGMRELRFLAMPAASELVFIGPVGSSHSHARRSGRRLNPNHNTPDACVHGVVDVHSAVVRTTETMAIHSSSLCRGENHEMMTKRKIVFATMRVLVLGQLQRPGTERTRVDRLAESKCGV